MRQRILSAVVGLAVLFAALCGFATVFFNISLSIVCMIAVYEVLLATKCIKFKTLTILSICFGGAVPFMNIAIMAHMLPVFCYLFFVILFIVIIIGRENLKIEQIGLVFMMMVVISLSLNCAARIRDTSGVGLGVYYLLIALGSAWWADSGAFFVGSLIGKHQLAPKISPNKTIEGFLGGIVVAVLGNLLISYIIVQISAMPWFLAYAEGPIRVNYLYVVCVTPILAISGVLGDLSASVIKRQCNVKDFGYIMPGHGGVLDRFDSVLFVLPLVYVFSRFFPFASLV